ncbi:hypothetical protein ABW19_dt0206263 [Dactylella cylindrospora]|nr:hypothetical protein ABW19_dt0206263 [Dactylella cylindrospora]
MTFLGQTEKYRYTLLSAATRGPSPKTQFLRFIPIVSVILIFALFTFTPLYSSRRQFVKTWPSWVDTTNPAEYLNATRQPLPVPGADDSLLMIKTGASVLWQRLPIHMTRLKEIYAPNQVIYSDLEETIQGHRVIDILANVSSKLSSSDEFKPYHEQKKLHAEGVSLADAHIEGGWTLDKYKWLPMFQHAYLNYPDMKWYIFYEADSFLFWNALNRWLITNFDSNEEWYMGSRNLLSGTLFGHGGSGIVVSNGAMKKVFGGEGLNLDDFDDQALSVCCGDGLLGQIFEKKGVKMWSEKHARFQGEQTWGIRYSQKEWCEPIFTLHHLKPMEVSMLHEWEKTLDPSQPILYRDLYERFVHREISDRKKGWDNLSEDKKFKISEVVKEYYENSEVAKDDKGVPKPEDACKMKCRDWKDCMQWEVTGKECKLNGRIRLGQKKGGATSGWMGQRINSLRYMKQCSS